MLAAGQCHSDRQLSAYGLIWLWQDFRSRRSSQCGGRLVRIAAEVGDQDDTVTEERDAGASGHQAFLQLDVGDMAFVDPGVVGG